MSVSRSTATDPSAVVLRFRLAEDKWLQLSSPTRILRADAVADVRPLLDAVEIVAREQSQLVAGFVSYEAAARPLSTRPPKPALPAWPLAWFACFPVDSAELCDLPSGRATFHVGPLTTSASRRAFAASHAAIRDRLAAGDSYQVNHTFRLAGPFTGDVEAFFAALAARQPSRFAAYLHTGEWTVASVSPELFFAREAGPAGTPVRVTMRPMKGTAARAATPAEDAAVAQRLRTSAKECAENVMIVDMVRNDLGRVAVVGSVEVSDLLALEALPTVWQMKSTVTAQSAATLGELFTALHPCASVTGAPKRRTMEIIAALEDSSRGVYTGAIGIVRPDGSAQFSVAIRTAVITHAPGDASALTGELEFGVGSGITWDSNADDEYDECLLKARVLTGLETSARPGLLETLKWTPADGFALLDRHLDRLSASATTFGYPFDRTAIVAALQAAMPEAVPGEPSEAGAPGAAAVARRVRLVLDADGRIHVEHTVLVTSQADLRLALAAVPVDTSSAALPFLVHKTTRRDVYNQARAAAGEAFDDVILWNADGEVTESTVCSVVLDTADGRVTPPLACGLLPGTFRAQLLADGAVREGIVTVEMLREAGSCWLVNSVHGWRRGVLGSQ